MIRLPEVFLEETPPHFMRCPLLKRAVSHWNRGTSLGHFSYSIVTLSLTPNSGLPVGLTVLCRGSQYAWAAFVNRVLPVGIPSFLVPVHPRKDPLRAQRRNQPSRSGRGCVDRRVFYRARGAKELLARYLPWRARWSDYAVAILLPVLLLAVAASVNILLGAPWPATAQIRTWSDVLPCFAFVFLFVELGEETG